MDFSVNSRANAIGIAGRLVGSLFFGVFLLAGLAFEIAILRQTTTDLATYGWSTTEAVIISSEISPPKNNESDPVLHVRYSYTFRGTQQEGDSIEAGSKALETSEAYRLAERYVPGTHVPCWVNPKNSAETVLQRKSHGTAFIALFPLIFVAIGGFGLRSVWTDKTIPYQARAISNSANKSRNARRIMAIFFGVFLLAGCGFTYALFVAPAKQIFEARNWVQVPCEIVSSRVKANSDSDGTTYRIDVVYRYTYRGRTYTSNRYNFSTGSSSGNQDKEAVVRGLEPGTQATCYVDPQDPINSVLKPNDVAELWFGLFPLIFVVVGAGGLIFTFRTKSERSRTFATLPSWQPSSGVSAPFAANSNGLQTLKPAAPPKKKLVGITFAALFWNGIVSVFVVSVIAGKWGPMNWFMALFLIPFVLIGLWLIGRVFYQIMALFNPRPRLTVSRSVVLPGDTIDLSWELGGRANVLQRLQIAFEGREEATYRNGSNTCTDKEKFFEIQIVDTTDPIAIRSGSAKLHIPPVTMHSFKSPNNKIVWLFKVHGDIPRWPDVDDEYLIQVVPNPIAK
jgi:hypothetical protein